MTMLSTTATCWAVGLYMILSSFVVGSLELPLLFGFIECLKPWAAKSEKVLPWHRAAFYCGLSVFCFFCLGASSLFAAILFVASGFFYGMAALGPRVSLILFFVLFCVCEGGSGRKLKDGC